MARVRTEREVWVYRVLIAGFVALAFGTSSGQAETGKPRVKAAPSLKPAVGRRGGNSGSGSKTARKRAEEAVQAKLQQAELQRLRLARLKPAIGQIVNIGIRGKLPPLTSDASPAERSFRAMAKADWPTAIAAFRQVRDPLTRKVLIWYRLQSKTGGASFAQISQFMRRNPHWPLQLRLRYRAEYAMGWSGARDRDVLAFFKDKPPRTVVGAMRLAEALRHNGRQKEATALLKRTWARGRYYGRQERKFLQKFGDSIGTDDHAARVHYTIYRRKFRSARGFIRAHKDKLSDGHKALFAARMVLGARRWPTNARVEKALAKVPAELRAHPALNYDLIRWHRRKNRIEEAATLLKATDASNEPEKQWWRQRAWVARVALRLGKHQMAYEAARDHRAKSRLNIYEGEWLAGWIALRFLRDPRRAKPHFERLYKLAGYPVSWARGAYWLGRTAEASGDRRAAIKWYQTAGRFVQTFYGQFALAKLGQRQIALPLRTQITKAQRIAFERMELVRAVRRLHVLRQAGIARWFVFAAFDHARTPAERSLASNLGVEVERLESAVRTAKYAGKHKQFLLESGYPIIMLPTEIGPEPALILSLIRQESEFNHEAISWAGARGLMQLMPRTAHRTARSIKVKYDRRALTRDPDYNLMIGTSHVVELMEELDNNFVLVAGSYNAGINAVKFWMSVNGDPRGGGAERWIDWIEAIPVDETRNYVQRVVETIQIYRIRFGDRSLMAANVRAAWRGTLNKIDIAGTAKRGGGKGCVTVAAVRGGKPAC